MCASAANAGPALPSTGIVGYGQASFAVSGSALAINQSSQQAIINWSNFSIGHGASVQFNNGSGATLNRVIGGSVSSLDGFLGATGSVYLINPNGVVIGKSGVIAVGGTFAASTLDIDDRNFLRGGSLRFGGPSQATVINLGRVGALGGNVALIAATVENDGVITAPSGVVGLVAGQAVLMRDTAQDNGQFLVQVGGSNTSATNRGTIAAAAVELRAQGGNIYALAGNTGGVINAVQVSSRGGHIWLTAPGGSVTMGQGSVIDASPGKGASQNRPAAGGEVTVRGQNIAAAGVIKAQGTGAGAEGGSVSIIAQGRTTVAGVISAAGSAGGKGGAIETSGESLGTAGAVIDAGLGGTWLLDPYNLTIGSAATSATQNPTGKWTSGSGGLTVLNTDINAALNLGTSVTLRTSGVSGDGYGNGDITVAAPISKTGGGDATLTLIAQGSIILNAGSAITSSSGKLGVTLDANTLGAGGYVSVGSWISTNGGAIVIGGGASPSTTSAVGTAASVSGVWIKSGSSLNSAGGNITINGQGYQGGGAASGERGVQIAGTISANDPRAGMGGTISIIGIGGNSTGVRNYGISQSSAITTNGTGNITLNGRGGGTSNNDWGCYIGANVTAGSGNISIQGVASATGTTGNHGVVLSSGMISTGGSGTIAISGTATGSGTQGSNYGVYLTGGTISDVYGLITVTGLNNSTGSGSNNDGLLLSSGSITSTGAGGIALNGTGGGSGAGGADMGIDLEVANALQSTNGGTITITGIGGDSLGSGDNNYGVEVGAALNGHGGTISIRGTGGNSSGISNVGVSQDAAITNTGAGAINITGTGGGTGSSEYGYASYVPGDDITAVTGNIVITASASATGTGSDNNGAELLGGTISTSGGGTITLIGTASGSGTGGSSYGVFMSSPLPNGETISAVDGLVMVIGLNNATGAVSHNVGVIIQSGTVASSGTGGVAIYGNYNPLNPAASYQSGAGAGGSDYGVDIEVANGVQSTGTGSVLVVGVGGDGGGSGGNNFGVQIGAAFAASGGTIVVIGTGGNSSGGNNYGIDQMANITNTGTGSIALTGLGGGAGSAEVGYYTTANVTTGTGNIMISGTGSANASGGGSHGASLSGGMISTGGSGTITIKGVATGNGAGQNTAGVYIHGTSIGGVDGRVTIVGLNGSTGSGSENLGVYLSSGAVSSSGAGGIAIYGNYDPGNPSLRYQSGSGAGGSDYGVAVLAVNGLTSTGTGPVTIIGIGGDLNGSGGSNVGVNLMSATRASGGLISIIGTGGNSSGNGN